jgi:hypothetical protein
VGEALLDEAEQLVVRQVIEARRTAEPEAGPGGGRIGRPGAGSDALGPDRTNNLQEAARAGSIATQSQTTER